MKVQKVQDWLSLLTLVGAVVLIVAYSIALRKMKRGTKFELFMQLIILLLISSCAAVVLAISSFMTIKLDAQQGPQVVFWITMVCTSFLVYLVCFNVAHYLFALEYFSIATVIQDLIKGREMTRR